TLTRRFPAALILILTMAGLVGCQEERPTWWRFRGDQFNRGWAQADGASDSAGLEMNLSGTPDLVAGPVMWSDATHARWTDSVVLVGHSGSLFGVVPSNASQPWRATDPNSFLDAVAAPRDRGKIFATVSGSAASGPKLIALPPGFSGETKNVS